MGYDGNADCPKDREIEQINNGFFKTCYEVDQLKIKRQLHPNAYLLPLQIRYRKP